MIKSVTFQDCLKPTNLFALLFFVSFKVWATLEGISVNNQGIWGNNDFEQVGWGRTAPSISADGRYVVFSSLASNLVPGDTNNASDVFLRDRLQNTTKRISVASDGSEANGGSFADLNSVDRSGRFVVFGSAATNLLGPGVDNNGHFDIFLYDIQTGTTTLVSRPPGFPGIQADGISRFATISADGNWVAFLSHASNLVSGDVNGAGDIFLFHRPTEALSLVSVDSSGQQQNGSAGQPSINEDGTKIAFSSSADNLVLRDTNGLYDVFVRDLVQRKTVRASVSDTGTELKEESLDPSISNNGCQVLFQSAATNAISGRILHPGHTYLRDICQNTTSWLSQNFEGKELPSTINNGHADISVSVLSGNGQCVLFSAYGPNLSNWGHVDESLENLYLRNLRTGTLQLISVTNDGAATNGRSEQPSLNEDCDTISFISWATNLIPGSPHSPQVFIYTPPKLTAAFVTTSTTPLTIHFDSTNSTSQGGSITTYAWDFGDGATSNGPNPNHAYAEAGTYLAKLTVTDNAYNSASTQQEVTVPTPTLGGGGWNLNCSTHPGSSQGFSSAWLYLIVLSLFLLIAGQFSKFVTPR